MNKTFKSVRNGSTGAVVAAGEGTKARGKSGSKLSAKLASASLVIGASVALLSSEAFADDAVQNESSVQQVYDAANTASPADAIALPQADDASQNAGDTAASAQPRKMLGAQLLGATPTGSSVLYDDATADSITFTSTGTAGTRLSNVAAGSVSANSMDAVNGSQLFHLTDGSTVVNSAYFKTVGKNDGTDNASISNASLSVAIGPGAVVSQSDLSTSNAVAIGAGATINENSFAGSHSTAIGAGSTAQNGGTAIGANSSALAGTGSGALAVGNSATAAGLNSVVLGDRAMVNNTSYSAAALGSNASVTAAYSVALGARSVADRYSTVSVGSSTLTRQLVNMAAGTSTNDAVNYGQLQAAGLKVDTNGVATNSFVAYDNTSASSITFTSGTAGTRLSNVAAGSISAGSMDAVNGSQLFHVTDGSMVANSAYIKVNGAGNGTDNATSSSGGGIAIGANAHSDTGAYTGTIAIGSGANATAGGYYGSSAFGAGSSADAGATVVGYQSVGQTRSSVLGRNATAASFGVAVGYTSSASGMSSVAVGNTALATGGSAVALGQNASASGNGSVAIGFGAVATDANSVSIGSSTQTRKIQNLAAGTSTTDAVNVGQLQAAGLTVNTSGVATNALVAYDSTARDIATLAGVAGTTVKNVAAGNIASATSMDAVNGGQLFATNQAVANNAANIAANTASIGTLNTQMSDVVSYDSAAHTRITLGGGTAGTVITNVTVGGLSATSTDAVNGSQLFATNENVATNTTDIAANTSAIAENTTHLGTIDTQVGTLNTQMADTVKYDSAAHDTLTLAGTSGTTLTNVKAGDITSAASTDAVNGGQLFATNENVATNTSDIAANTSAIAANTTHLGTIDTQVGTLNTQMADTVKYDSAAHDTLTLDGTSGTTLTNVKAGDITSAASTDAVNGGQLFATNQNVATNTSDIAANTSAIAGNTTHLGTIDTQVGTLNTQMADTVKYDSAAHDTLTLDGTSGTTLTNVKAGDITSAASTDAVNGGQLFATNQNVATNTSDIAANTSAIAGNTTHLGTIDTQVGTLNTQMADTVKYDSAAHDTLTLDGTSGTTLTNVKAGDITSAASTDAVNGGQLFATNQNVATNTASIGTLNTQMSNAVSYDSAAHTKVTLGGGTAGTVITNVAAGAVSANSTDAVNGAELFAVKQTISSQGAGLANAVAYDSDAQDTVTLGGTAGTVITNVKAGDITSATSTDAVNGGQLFATNQNVTKNTSDIAANTSAIDQNTAHLGTLDTQMADTVKYDTTAHDTVTLAGTSGTTLTNVKAGDITSAASLDAVNGGQLFATNQNVAKNTSDIAANTSAIDQNSAHLGTLDTQMADTVKYDTTAHDSLTLAGTSGTTLTNVKAGDITSATSTDAVNGSQLFATNQNVSQNTSDIAANTASIGTLNTQMSNAVSYDSAAHTTITLGGGTAGTVITNVAAGDVSATSTDAVNGAELFAVKQSISSQGADLSNAVAYDSPAHDMVTLGGTTGTVITNVKAGDITSATSTDAVNGGQLFATNQNVSQNTSDIAANTASIGTLNTQMSNAVSYDSAAHTTITLGGGTAGTVITNVAAGAVSAESTDAVNGSQLFATNQNVTKNAADIDALNTTVADSVSYDSAAHSLITLGGGAAGTRITNLQAGALSAASTDAVNGAQLYATNQNVASNTADITNLNSALNAFTSGSAGMVEQDPLTQALTVGANLGGGTVNFAGSAGARVLTGVASGSIAPNSVDAVNGSQLFGASASVASALGGGAGVAANGAVTSPSYSVGGTVVHDVGAAVGNLDARVTQNTADIAGMQTSIADVSKVASNAVAYDSADHSKITLGGTDAASDAVQLTHVAAGDLSSDSTDAVNGSQLGAVSDRVAATESSIANIEQSMGASGTASGNDASATGAHSSASGDNATAMGANSSASGDSATATGANASASGSNSTANGANAIASGDSASAFGNGSSATGDNSIAHGAHSQASGEGSAAIGAGSVASADNAVALGANSVANEANTVSVGSAGSERRVTNVAPGVNGTDAVNVDQMNQLRGDVGASLTSLQRAAYGGVAAAMAMPNLMPSAPGKTVVGAGVANYKGYSAVAAGATYRSGNGNWLVNGAASVSQNGDVGVRAQAGYEF